MEWLGFNSWRAFLLYTSSLQALTSRAKCYAQVWIESYSTRHAILAPMKHFQRERCIRNAAYVGRRGRSARSAAFCAAVATRIAAFKWRGLS